MKRILLVFLGAAALVLLTPACEMHSASETVGGHGDSAEESGESAHH